MNPLAVVTLVLAGTSTAPEMWAGTALVAGTRAVPFLGKVEAKTTSIVLAEVTRIGRDRITLVQRTCAIELENPTGVELALLPGAAEKLPPVTLEFVRRPDGLYYQSPATSGWDKEDVDRDGNPGMTLTVGAPICGGKIFAGIKTTSQSRGNFEAGGVFKGELRARIHQQVHDTEGACLGVLVKTSDEKAEGRFTYAPAAPGTTCATIARPPR